MPDDAELLERYKPHLIYDSQESYFADSAAEWTDAPGHLLLRADRKTVLAATSPEEGQPQLSLDFLADKRYASGKGVRRTDLISRPKKDYLEAYRHLHPEQRYRNRVYGRAVDGRAQRWLQYWFFYFYNDAPLKWIGYGRHEGDWEMVELRLGDDGTPDLAVYAQHKEAGVREWVDVEKNGDTPVVYVARGAHASYFRPGHHWNDRALGGRPAPELELERLSESWATWPGVWGDTDAESDLKGQSSPRGPCDHAQWSNPDALIPKAMDVSARGPAPAGPPHPERITAVREDGKAVIGYRFPSGRRGVAASLLVTINSPDDHYPPATYTLPITAGEGTVEAPLQLEDERGYQIHVSAQSEDGMTTSPVERTLAPES